MTTIPTGPPTACGICYAQVDQRDAGEHLDWHLRLDRRLQHQVDPDTGQPPAV